MNGFTDLFVVVLCRLIFWLFSEILSFLSNSTRLPNKLTTSTTCLFVSVLPQKIKMHVASVNFPSFVAIKQTVQQIDFTSFYLVSSLRFSRLLLVPLRDLLIHSHIVCIVYMFLVLLFFIIVCEN